MTQLTKEFNADIIRELVLDESTDIVDGIEFVDSTGWQDDGKYSHNTYYFRNDGKLYEVSDSRSGSYFSDFYYESSEEWGDTVECMEVRIVTLLQTAYIPVTENPTPAIDYPALVSAAQEFVDKVRSGQARSVKSYAAFCMALGIGLETEAVAV